METFRSLRESQDLAMIIDIEDYVAIESLVIEWCGENVNSILRDWIQKDYYGDNGIYILWDPEVGPESAMITAYDIIDEIQMFTEFRDRFGMLGGSTFMSKEYLNKNLDHIENSDEGIEFLNKDGITLLSCYR